MVVSPYHPEPIPEVPVHLAILSKLAEHGDEMAVVDGVTGESYTYSQVLGLVQKIASGLARLGVQKGDVMAIFSPNSIDYPLMLLAGMLAGAVVTTANPAYTKYELEYHLKDSTAQYVYTVPSHYAKVKEVARDLPGIKKVICDGGDAASVALASLKADDGSLAPGLFGMAHDVKEDVALLPYSSGTTGLPKGVMLTHSNLVSNIMQFAHPSMQPLPENVPEGRMVALCLLPMYHVYGMIGCTLMTLAQKVLIVVLAKFQPKVFLGAIEKYKVTMLPLVPPLIIFLSKSPLVKNYDLSSVQGVNSGAAPLSSDAEKEFVGQFNSVIRQGFGMTETTVACIGNSQQRTAKAGSVGQLLPMTEGKIIDPDTGKSVGAYERGELCIRGPQVMKGYWNKPEATKNTVDEFGFLHTGDIAYYDAEGYFFIVDRIKELIKCKGLQVAPAELEAVLLTHPKVADVGVTSIPHPTAGEVPRAYVVLKPRQPATVDEIKAFVADKVAAYKQLDGGVIFVPEIPKSPSGKILRRKLKEMAKSKM